MTTPVVVNGDVSLILVNTRNLTANQSAVVLLSSLQSPGRTVTIRDSVGFLSTPQTIVVSTIGGVSFADGASSVVISQPYGSLSVTSRDPTSWNLVNSFAFPQNETIANVRSLTTSSITTSNLFSQTFISTPYLTLLTAQANSTLATFGPTYTSTLVVGPPPTVAQPPRTDPGYAAYIQGTMRIQGAIDVDGAARFTGQISTSSNVIVAGSISTNGSLGARGDIQTLGNINAPFGSVIGSNLDVRGVMTVGGVATFSNSLTIASNLFVQNGISTQTYTTSTLSVASSINFQEKFITWRPTDLLFSDAITVPSLSTNNLVASNSLQTSNLTVTNSITAPTVTSFLLGSAAIVNPSGSLTISTITANTAVFSNVMSTSQLQTSSMTGSTIFLTGNIVAPAGGYLNINSLITSSLSTGILAADTVFANNFTTTSLNLSKLILTSEFVANNVSSFQVSNVAIDNRGGTISTASLSVRDLVATSSITNRSGLFSTATSTLRFVAPNVILENATISTLAASTITTSTLNTTQLTIGAPPPAATLNGPIFTPEFTYPSTNVVISGGPGDYLTPFTVSNVKPPGIGVGQPYTVDASFALNFNGPTLPGYYANILGLTLFQAGETNCQLSIKAYNDSNTIVTLYGLFGVDQNYATPPNTGGIPVPPDPLPSSFLHITGTMYGNSAFSLQFLSRSNDNFVAIDSNAVITMTNGALRWPYFLNGTTIQNSLNDMTLRNLFYYGALNFASDPLLKEDIQAADLNRCSEIISSLPLKRYKYIDSYLSTFHQRDTYRLGLLATDVETIFPHSITYTTLTDLPGLHSTVRLLDTQQVEMAHIGATQALLHRVKALTEALAEAQATLSSLAQG